MQIDSATLRDLEVFSASDGTGGIFDLIDHTRTNRGRRALRRRLRSPSADLLDIQDIQKAVRFLRDHPSPFIIDEELVQSVERYLACGISTRSSTALGERAEAIYLFLRYRPLLKEIQVGLERTHLLLHSIRSVISGYESHNTPVVIAKILTELHEIADLLASGGSGGLLRRDRLYRHTIPHDVLRALELVGELDALTSMGRAAADLDWVFPEFIKTNGFVFDAEGIFHPFVPGAVPNPVQLSHDTPMLFLTGPNMAGKTTYLRAAALVMLLGQTGLPVPAESARLSPVEEIFTGFSVADNLKGGVSLFLAEVHRVKEAATLLAEGRSAFILFDEVFKGTNVKEALDASAEVMMGFAQAPRCGFIFSSHISELEDALKQTTRIQFAYFDGQIESGDPTYSYQLRQGVSDQRFGLLLLHEAKIPELIARIGETGRPNE